MSHALSIHPTAWKGKCLSRWVTAVISGTYQESSLQIEQDGKELDSLGTKFSSLVNQRDLTAYITTSCLLLSLETYQESNLLIEYMKGKSSSFTTFIVIKVSCWNEITKNKAAGCAVRRRDVLTLFNKRRRNWDSPKSLGLPLLIRGFT